MFKLTQKTKRLTQKTIQVLMGLGFTKEQVSGLRIVSLLVSMFTWVTLTQWNRL